MVKQRMSTPDIAAEVACLRQKGIVGMRVINVYDISPKMYVLKFARSGDNGEKVLLLIESGARLHTVDVMPEKSDVPSNFSLKLRKHIRSRRLESIAQLGVDRIVQFTFSAAGGDVVHLLLEFYSQGNVILADSKYEVLTLLRSHRDDAKGMAIMSRHIYPIHSVRLRQPVASEALKAAVSGGAVCSSTSTLNETIGSGDPGEGASSSNSDQNSTLKAVIASAVPYGPLVAEHCILSAGLDPKRHVAAVPPLTEEDHAALLAAVRSFEKWLDGCEEGSPPGGAILLARNGKKTSRAESEGDVETSGAAAYDEFQPLLTAGKPMAQHAGLPMLTFPTYDAAVAEFFGQLQGQRKAAQQAQREKAALGKLEAIRRDHESRLETLGREADAAERKAALIELNLDAVDAALNAVCEALAGGIDWADLARMIKEEKKAGNPVAALIHSLQLDKNRITVLLRDEAYDDDEEGDEDIKGRAGGGQESTVEVDLQLSAHANARAYYDSRKKHADKTRRTLEANERALAAAEKRAREQLERVRCSGGGGGVGTHLAAAAARKPYWFERFHWFISSENYLVLSGRDAQQNELLVKRYLGKADAYVHADLHGASTTIVKNNDPSSPIPPLTLIEAGQACVCRSAAWDAKIVTAAWWVRPDQVSKTAPTGEYLTTGSFMIRGRKNYLPPQPLVMGLGWLFKLEEGSIAAHLGERAPRWDIGGTPVPAIAEGLTLDQRHQDEDGEEDATRSTAMKKKSALEAFMDSSVEALVSGMAIHHDEEEKANFQARPSNRHLSAKERQLLKKGIITPESLGKNPPQEDGGEHVCAEKEKEVRDAPSSVHLHDTEKLATQKGRGGGGGGGGKKARRKALKYEDQDEEERALAMALLQSAGQKKDRKSRKEDRKVRMAARKASKSGIPSQEVTAEDIARLTARLDTAQLQSEEPKSEKSLSESEGERERKGDNRSGVNIDAERPAVPDHTDVDEEEMANHEREEVAQLLAEENVGILDAIEREHLTQLDELTGCPRPEDVLLYAIPVCAPYQVLNGYKFRVKLVPGTVKKGKAYRQGVELLAGRGGDGTAQREKELMRAVPELDGIHAMLGGVKLQVAGLQKLQQAKKKAGKKKQ